MSGIRVNEWLHNSGTGGIWQSSAGNVGIASSVPTAKLVVTGDANISGVTTAVAFVPSAGQLSHRNLIINGAFQIAQRGTSSTSEGYKTVDRWYNAANGEDEAVTQAQVALTSSDTGPWAKGFRTAYQLTNGNQTGGAGAADYSVFVQAIEAQNLSNSGWDYTSASSYLSLSFWVKSSVAQNFYGRFQTVDGTAQNYTFETGTLSANTWTKVTKKIPGHANITIDNNNGKGLEFSFVQFYGTDRTGSVSLDTWGAYASGTRTPNMTSTWWTTNDSTFAVTGVQLEVGSAVTPFEHLTYGDELNRCLRYYYKTGHGVSMNSDTPLATGFNRNTTHCQAIMTFPLPMRVPPTAIETSGSGGDYQVSYLTSSTSCNTVPTFDTANTTQAHVYFILASGLTAGQGSRASTDGAGISIAFSAEF